MEYRIKSMVIGFRLAKCESESLKPIKDNLVQKITALYPKQIYVIDSRITVNKSYDDRFLIFSYYISYYYDGLELIKSVRNELMETFKIGVKKVLSEYFEAHDIEYNEILN